MLIFNFTLTPSLQNEFMYLRQLYVHLRYIETVTSYIVTRHMKLQNCIIHIQINKNCETYAKFERRIQNTNTYFLKNILKLTEWDSRWLYQQSWLILQILILVNLFMILSQYLQRFEIKITTALLSL